MSDSVRPQRRQPTRLRRPWDSPGKNTGVGCPFLLQCMKVKSESEVAQSCLTLATPWTAAYQAPLSTGFSRQEYWSGVPVPSPMLTWKQNQHCHILDHATLPSSSYVSFRTKLSLCHNLRNWSSWATVPITEVTGTTSFRAQHTNKLETYYHADQPQSSFLSKLIWWSRTH